MDVYIYQADMYCKECGEKIRAELTAAGKAPAKPDDETTYDSDEFPKGPFPDGGGESDTVQHCACGENCINALDLPDEPVHLYGAWLENDLTRDGVNHLKEMIAERSTPVTEFWRKEYTDKGYDLD